MRSRRLVVLLGIVSLIGLTTLLLSRRQTNPPAFPPKVDVNNPVDHGAASKPSNLPESSHPIAGLMNSSESTLRIRLSQQSQTLSDAVKEYERRYGMRPPPKFDVWFKFAQDRGVQLIDEFDTIYHSILPFWGLPPKTIRDRAREAMGFDNVLICGMIRNGKVAQVIGGSDGQQWKRDALTGMIQTFVEHLPDMDLPFNIHDEPRVVLSSEDLQRLVTRAKDVSIPDSWNIRKPRNSFSSRPADVNKGDRLDEFRTTRFNRFAHQATWTHSRISCPVDSPSRDLDENREDDTSYALGELGFIQNITAFSDICLSPSLRYTFGLFDRPNAVDLVHDLFPIFSESKVSSYQDILYPSPWYWAGKVTYDPKKDMPWESKKDQLYWRGSTTGGFSRAGGWRRQHRQLFVKDVNAIDGTKVLSKTSSGSWETKEARRREYKSLFNVKFSHIGQCDPEDCDAQSSFFEVVKPDDQQAAWQYKYLLDMDGNAFSGRYFAFLQSNSLIYKLAIFREWHNEWLYPWVHYVPLSLKGDEHFESVRYFAQEEEGQARAAYLAEQSQEWARKALRNEDLEVWFFRLLLE